MSLAQFAPLPVLGTDIPSAARETFRLRYAAAKDAIIRWRETGFNLGLPQEVHDAWAREWADRLFECGGQFRTPTDLRALALAVRETLANESFCESIDSGCPMLWVLDLSPEMPDPRSFGLDFPSAAVYGSAAGFPLPAVLRRATDGYRVEVMTQRLNRHLGPGGLDRDGRELLRRMVWYEESRKGPRAARAAWELGDPRLPGWRVELLRFCREATIELAFRGFVVDPLPDVYPPKTTFDVLVNDLLRRANEGDRCGCKIPAGAELLLDPVPGFGRGTSPERAEDFSWVRCSHGRFEFTKPQRRIVAALWADWEKDGLGLPGESLLKLIGEDRAKLPNKFKHCAAWGTLIVQRLRGKATRYTLDLPKHRP